MMMVTSLQVLWRCHYTAMIELCALAVKIRGNLDLLLPILWCCHVLLVRHAKGECVAGNDKPLDWAWTSLVWNLALHVCAVGYEHPLFAWGLWFIPVPPSWWTGPWGLKHLPWRGLCAYFRWLASLKGAVSLLLVCYSKKKIFLDVYLGEWYNRHYLGGWANMELPGLLLPLSVCAGQAYNTTEVKPTLHQCICYVGITSAWDCTITYFTRFL